MAGLLDGFNSGWLGQLVNASGGVDNPGWAFLKQLAVGPQGGPIDRYVNGSPLPGATGQGGIGSDYASSGGLGLPAQSAPALPPPVNIGSPPQPAQPDSAALPPNAQPIQQQGMQQAAPINAPPPPQLRGSDILSTLGSIFLPNTTARLQGAAAQQQLVNGTYQALISRGYDPKQAGAIAMGIIANPKLAETIMPQALGLNPPKNLEELIARSAAGEKFSGSGTNVGNAVALRNELKRSEASAEAVGKAQGAAEQALPTTLANVDQSIMTVNDLINDPNLKYATGLYGKTVGKIPGTPGFDTSAKLGQVTGQAALVGLQSLKGIGRINQKEFEAGTNAVGRLQQGQSEGSMREALRELRDVYTKARTRAGVQAGVGETPPPAVSAGSFSQDQLLAEARKRGLVK